MQRSALCSLSSFTQVNSQVLDQYNRTGLIASLYSFPCSLNDKTFLTINQSINQLIPISSLNLFHAPPILGLSTSVTPPYELKISLRQQTLYRTSLVTPPYLKSATFVPVAACPKHILQISISRTITGVALHRTNKQRQ